MPKPILATHSQPIDWHSVNPAPSPFPRPAGASPKPPPETAPPGQPPPPYESLGQSPPPFKGFAAAVNPDAGPSSVSHPTPDFRSLCTAIRGPGWTPSPPQQIPQTQPPPPIFQFATSQTPSLWPSYAQPQSVDVFGPTTSCLMPTVASVEPRVALMLPRVSQALFKLGIALVLRRRQATQAICVSPFSVGYALALLVGGADDTVFAAYATQLGADMATRDTFAHTFKALKAIVDASGRLTSGNSVVATKGVPLNPSFRAHVELLEAVIDQEHGEPAGVEKAVDDFIASVAPTAGRPLQGINDVPGGDVSQATHASSPLVPVLYIVNVLSFKVQWADAWEWRHTKSHYRFQTGASSTRTVDMMMKWEKEVDTFDTDDYTAVRLHFKDGFDFIAWKPKPGSARDVESTLGAIARDGGVPQNGHWTHEKLQQLGLPKADIKYKALIQNDVAALGFQRDRMPYVWDAPYVPGAIVHQTTLKWDEEGAEGTAVTIVATFGAAPGPPPALRTIVFDEPFVYAIVNRHASANLPIMTGVFT